MGVAFKIQVPPVFIHFTFGVSIKKKRKNIEQLGYLQPSGNHHISIDHYYY
jgi:hypothetical protein